MSTDADKPSLPTMGPESVQAIFDKIAKDFSQFKPLLALAISLNIHPGQLVVGIFVLAFLLIILGIGDGLIASLIGSLYPA